MLSPLVFRTLHVWRRARRPRRSTLLYCCSYRMCGPPVGAVFFWEGSFMANTSYRAILFDLDGTLCPMELDEFLGGYFKDIARFAAEQGIDGEKFARAFGAGASAMAKREPGGKTNYDVFWDGVLRRARSRRCRLGRDVRGLLRDEVRRYRCRCSAEPGSAPCPRAARCEGVSARAGDSADGFPVARSSGVLRGAA